MILMSLSLNLFVSSSIAFGSNLLDSQSQTKQTDIGDARKTDLDASSVISEDRGMLEGCWCVGYRLVGGEYVTDALGNDDGMVWIRASELQQLEEPCFPSRVCWQTSIVAVCESVADVQVGRSSRCRGWSTAVRI